MKARSRCGSSAAPSCSRSNSASLRVEQLESDAARDEVAEILGVRRSHLGMRGLARRARHERERLAAQLVEQEARGDEAVAGLTLDQRPRAHDQRSRQVRLRDAVEHAAQRLGENRLGRDVWNSGARFSHHARQTHTVERHELAGRAYGRAARP